MNNQFIIPHKIISGAGALESLSSELSLFGKKALIVTGKHTSKDGTLQQMQTHLNKAEISATIFDEISGEPTDKMISAGLALYRKEHCDFLIGIGGGSTLDAMKAIAAMSALPGELASYMGKDISGQLPPMIAIPTTAGTGSEATQVTIITDTENNVKMLLKGPALMPDLAIIDPALSLSTPMNITASTGLDALTHSIEAYTSKKAQPLTDTLALSAVQRIFENLPIVYRDGSNLKAREEMSIAALEAGIAFNNSSVTLVHGMSRPIGALFHVPHGISNAMLLDVCLRYALPGAFERFASLGRIIGVAGSTTSDEKAANLFLEAVKSLCQICEIPTLKSYGIDRDAFYAQIEKMSADAMASGSPSNTRQAIDKDAIQALYAQLYP